MNDRENPMVGAAKVDITPDYGTQISGDLGRYRPVEEIRDPLYARIIIIKLGETRICIISCDMACVSREQGLKIRAMVADSLGTIPENIMLHCTQSHSAARLGGIFVDQHKILSPDLWWVTGETPAYNELFMRKIQEGIETAKRKLAAARMKFARAIDGRCAFNRRFVMRDGSARTHPKNCDENILYCEGTIDPEASLVLFETHDSSPIAGLLHYTCHPTHGYPKRYISADWPGLWSEMISKKLGNNCVVGCINGACGNISPGDHANPDFDLEQNLEVMMSRLTQTGQKLINNLKIVTTTPVEVVSDILKVPYLNLPLDAAEKARSMIKEHPTPIFLDEKKEQIAWEWVFALRDLDRLYQIASGRKCEVEIQVFRIGDLAVVGWPGEPFVEAQLEVKLLAKAPFIIVGHECNGDGECGYLPTMKAYSGGGYETWGKLPQGTLEKISQRTVTILDELFINKENLTKKETLFHG